MAMTAIGSSNPRRVEDGPAMTISLARRIDTPRRPPWEVAADAAKGGQQTHACCETMSGIEQQHVAGAGHNGRSTRRDEQGSMRAAHHTQVGCLPGWGRALPLGDRPCAVLPTAAGVMTAAP